MKRLIDWQRRFNEYLASVRGKQFIWGEFDCCIFAADAVLAVTGEDLMYEFRGKYSSRLEAAQLLRELGSGTLLSTIEDRMGPPIAGAFGKRADVAVFDNNLGLVTGRYGMFLVEELPGRFLFVPITKIEKVFSVPFHG